MKIIEVTIVKTQSDSVLARADVHFDGFWVKGFKVIRGVEPNHEYVTPPSYSSPKGWRKLFQTDSPDDWQEIQRRILDTYNTHLMNDSLSEEN